MADVYLPSTLPPLFPGLDAAWRSRRRPCREAFDRLDERWPGLRDRLCEPGHGIRRHINVYVDRERAELDTPVGESSRVDVIAAISGG